jgi:hypothetical protein
MAPFTAVAAEASFDGCFGMGPWRTDREAAALAAFFFRAVRVLVLGAAFLLAAFFFATGRFFATARCFEADSFFGATRFAALPLFAGFAVRFFATPILPQQAQRPALR